MVSCANAQSEKEDDTPIETEEVISMAMDNPNFNKTPAIKQEVYEEDLSGNIIMLDDESFSARITTIDHEKGLQYKGMTPCIVDFYADWCRPCSALHPVLAELAKEYKGKLIIYKINTDKATTTAAALGINSIPTLLFFKRNKQPGMIKGALPKKELKKVIDQFLEEE
jgi:thioredoxin